MNFRRYFCGLAVSAVVILSSFSQETREEEVLVKKKTESYFTTYNQHDAKALAAYWTEEGEYVNPQTGEVVKGRAALEQAFQDKFSERGDGHLKVKIQSVTFPSKDKAIEIVVFTLEFPGQDTKKGSFKLFMKKDHEAWMIDQIREIEMAPVPHQYEYLKELEWLIGDWVDQDEDVNVELNYRWNESKNYILETFSVTTGGVLEQKGRQIILWDPLKKQIRSWVFDSDGGFGESTWTKKEGSWIVETAQTLADGQRASALNIFKPIDKDSYSWESTSRQVGGQLLPDIESVRVQRMKAESKS